MVEMVMDYHPLEILKQQRRELWGNQIDNVRVKDIKVKRPYWRIQGDGVYIHKGPLK